MYGFNKDGIIAFNWLSPIRSYSNLHRSQISPTDSINYGSQAGHLWIWYRIIYLNYLSSFQWSMSLMFSLWFQIAIALAEKDQSEQAVRWDSMYHQGGTLNSHDIILHGFTIQQHTPPSQYGNGMNIRFTNSTWARKKPCYFPLYYNCSIGILIMVYQNPIITG